MLNRSQGKQKIVCLTKKVIKSGLRVVHICNLRSAILVYIAQSLQHLTSDQNVAGLISVKDLKGLVGFYVHKSYLPEHRSFETFL